MTSIKALHTFLVERLYRVCTPRGSRPPPTLPGETGLLSGPFPVTVPSSEVPRTLGSWNRDDYPLCTAFLRCGAPPSPWGPGYPRRERHPPAVSSSRSGPRTFNSVRASQGGRRGCLPGDPAVGAPSHVCRKSADLRPVSWGTKRNLRRCYARSVNGES